MEYEDRHEDTTPHTAQPHVTAPSFLCSMTLLVLRALFAFMPFCISILVQRCSVFVSCYHHVTGSLPQDVVVQGTHLFLKHVTQQFAHKTEKGTFLRRPRYTSFIALTPLTSEIFKFQL